MKYLSVIGAGFGDEGKGLVTDYLSSVHEQPLVIRFSGGHQSGHHVVIDEIRDHVFSNFGSGSFRGVPTYWSQYCTVDPVGVINEWEVIKEKGGHPVLYINALCPVTTPFDVVHNRKTEAANFHGSCGVGVGATFEREKNLYSLVFGDLFYPSVFRIKLDLIRRYYQCDASLDVFLYCCDRIMQSDFFHVLDDLPQSGYETLIFEGSQGLLLGQNTGFFPHVTRSDTGTGNILDMGFSPEVFLVSRAYQTRHGNGPMTNEHIPHNIMENPYEKNTDHPYQGQFRRSLLDLDLLRYAISRDAYICQSQDITLVLTCLDLVDSEYRFTMNGRIVYCDDEHDYVSRIMEYLNIKKGLISRSPFASDITALSHDMKHKI